MKKIISIIFGSKFIFQSPKKANILLYDQGVRFNNLFMKSFKNRKFEIFYKRFEKINLYVLILTLLKSGYKNLKQNYLKNYIKIVNPKLVVTSNDVDILFYTIKKLVKKIKTIAVQRSFREINEFNLFKSKKKNEYCADYVFLFSSNQKKIFKRFISSKFIEIGSFANNFYKKKKNTKKQILLISQFIQDFENKKQFYHEKKILKFLINYCNKKNLKLKILLKNLSSYNYKDKKDYKSAKIYKKYFDFVDKDSIICQSNSKTNYNFLDENILVIFMDSALGLECISRGNKTLRIPLSKIKRGHIDPLLGKIKYDIHLLDNYLKFEKKLNFIRDYDQNLYFKKFNSKDLLYYDQNNKILKKMLKRLIN